MDEESAELDKEENDDITLSLSHEELITLTRNMLNELVKSEKLLSDLPLNVSLEEINSKIAVEYGQAMTVHVIRGDKKDIPVIVKHDKCRVIDLKKAFQRQVMLNLKREDERAKVSWKHVWRTTYLHYDGVKLESDDAFLKDYGIGNKSKVYFVKKLRKKRSN